VLRNIALLFFMIPVGISSSTYLLVGNNIGACDLIRGKFYSKMCLITGVIWSVLSVLAMKLLKSPLIYMFSSSEAVNVQILDVYFLLTVFVFFDCLQCVTVGVIKGLGKQGLASTITCCGYWVFGIPISIVSVYYFDLGMFGLWLGPTFAIIFNFTFYALFIWSCNWEKIIEDARIRRAQDKK
jgi:MATE family multidrug resistance protein